MAEQNAKDTKNQPPLRRGARPFVGPAGAAGQPLPLLRVTPMPRPAPFVPAPAARPPLGVVPRPVATPNPSANAAPAEARTAEIDAPAADTQAAVPPVDRPELGLDALVSWSGAGANAENSAPDITGSVAASAPDPLIEESAAEPVHSSPYDQFAAFDTAWHETSFDLPEPPAPPPSPTDHALLGSAEEAPAPPAAAAEIPTTTDAATAGPAWLMDDAPVSPAAKAEPVSAEVPTESISPARAAETGERAESHQADSTDTPSAHPGDEGSWADVSIMMSADSIMAAELEDEAGAQSAAGDLADNAFSTGEWPEPLLAEYAPYLPTPSIATPAIPAEPADAPEPTPVENAIDVPSDTVSIHAEVESDAEEPASPMGLIAAAWNSYGGDGEVGPESHQTRVAAVLDRLAEQVRCGEIDVSSIVPGSPDAAVLAAVLAALLGGGQSGSR